jgi:hypothetical protein
MDQQKLRSLVFDKTGVRIDIDDPIFALVALNEAVLAEAVERHVALLDEATRELAARAQALQDGGAACRYGGAAAPLAPPSMPPAPARIPAPAAAAYAVTRAERRLATIAAAAAVLGALLVLGGQALLFKPAAPPAPVVQAKELTPEQVLALRNGEKLAKAVQKLDQKARNALQAELQRP